MRTGFFILITLLATFVYGQKDKRKILDGNSAYQQKDFAGAIENYDRALNVNPESFEAEFNKADAVYKQDRYEEAAQQFQNLAAKAGTKEQKASAYHNMGNAHLNKYRTAKGENKKEADLNTAISSYKNALRNNPKDDETRYNLAHAQKLLQQLKQQQQQNQDQDKNEEKKDDKKEEENKKDKNENKDEKKEEEKKDNKDQKQKDEQEQEQQEKEEQKQEQQKPKLSKEDAQRMLDAMNNQERNTQEKLKKQKVKGKPVKIEKDW